MFEVKTSVDPMLAQVDQLRELNAKSWEKAEDELDLKLYLDESEEEDETNISGSSSASKNPVEILIMDPANEKKFETMVAKDEKLKTYKRRHSGDVETTPIKKVFEECGSGTDEEDEEQDYIPLGGKEDEDDEEETRGNRQNWKQGRDRDPSESSEATASSSRTANKLEIETDPEVLSRRQKQIDFGKNTVGYDNFRRQVPKYSRQQGQPRTPPMNLKYSRRAWDGLVKVWRRKLHDWDDKAAK